MNSSGTAARVCFVELEDTFIVLAFEIPPEFLWRKDKDGVEYHNGPRIASLKRYQDGVLDNSFYVPLIWHRVSKDDDDLIAEGKSVAANATLSIDPDETNFVARWPNKMNTITAYQLSIRIATGRFKETYDWKDEKGHAQEGIDEGHCFRYEDGTVE